MPEKTADNLGRNARDFYQKALAALERNNLDYSIEMFMECLFIEPNFLQGRKFLRAAQMKRAESVGAFKKMLTDARITPLLTRGKMTVAKNPSEAMQIAEQALSENPKSSQALSLLAEAAEACQMPETVAQTLETLTKLNPKDTKALHWLAQAYWNMFRHDLARDVYDRILQMHPSDSVAQKGIKDSTAHGAMQTGGWDEATSYRDVMKNKDEAVALEQQSRVVRADDMLANLIAENLTKLKQDPDNPLIRRELGKLYSQKGEYDTALKYFEELVSSQGGADPALEKEIGEIKIKRITEGIAALKAQLPGAGANAPAIQEKITALQREHDQLQLSDAERLVERYPNDMLYRFDLAELYMRTCNIQNAIEQFQKSVSQPQRRVASLNYLGQCFMTMGLHDLAIDQYVKASDELPMMDGLKKEITYNLGIAYEAIGETEKAISEFKKIAAVDFGYRDVREKITRKPPAK